MPNLNSIKLHKLDSFLPGRVGRQSCVFEVEYGFDFDLFGEIVSDKCRAVTSEDRVSVAMEKKERTEWSRLLASLVKVSTTWNGH